MDKKWYKITFNAELTTEDVRAINKCFYDIMNEAMDIYDLADLELKPNDDDYEITFSAKLTADDVKAMNGCFFSAMWEEMGIECCNLEIEEENFKTIYNPSDVDWIVDSNGGKYDKDGNLILNHKAAFNFKVGDIIIIGFLDDFGDISRAEKFKVIKNDSKHLVCESIL